MELVIEHPTEFKAYRVGYDSARKIAGAVGTAIVSSRLMNKETLRYVIMTKSGPKEALIGDWIVCRGPEEFDVCTLKEFHEKYVFKRAVSAGRRIRSSSKPRQKWNDYLYQDEAKR